MRHVRVAVAALLLATVSRADEGVIAVGKAAFAQQCARCHGAEGRGDGPDAKRVPVPPRDLTSGRFKWKTTRQGTPPSDDDLKSGIVSHGLPGSGMPSFANLGDDVKKGLVAYIKSISPAFLNASAPEPIPAPKNMKAAPDLKAGAEVYARLQCALCHGEGGRANGTSAFSLQDAWGRPIKPANLTQGWTYRGGDRPVDIYHRMLAGIDGAPMPSYEGAVSNEEAWLLSNYVASLQLKTNFSKDIVAARTAAELPTTADDKAWESARRTETNLQNFIYADGKRSELTVRAVSIQALFNDGGVAFRLAWDDPTESASPADALLLAMVPPDYNGDPRGNLLNLYAPADPALDLVFWQAASPSSVNRRVSNLAVAIRENWAGAASPAASGYDDGRYTLVFRIDAPKHVPARVGFAAWDGANRETGLKFAGSEWLWLHLGEQTAAHH